MPYLGMVEWLEHYWEQLQVQFLVSIVLISNDGKKGEINHCQAVCLLGLSSILSCRYKARSVQWVPL